MFQLSWAHSETSSSFLLCAISWSLLYICLSVSLGLIYSIWSLWLVLHQYNTMKVTTPDAIVPMIMLSPCSIIMSRKVITTVTYQTSSLTIQMSTALRIFSLSFRSRFWRNLQSHMIIINYTNNENKETPPTYHPKVIAYFSSRANLTAYFDISSADYSLYSLLRALPVTS